jgi:hypothetical protein
MLILTKGGIFMELEDLKSQLYNIADKVAKEWIKNSTVENEIQKIIIDSVTILSANISAKMIYEYEKLKRENP